MPLSPPPLYQAWALRGRSPQGRVLFSLPELHLSPGVTMVVGDEGRGKTTLLRLLAGQLPGQVAHALLRGHDLHHASDAYQAEVAWFDPSSTTWEQAVVDDLWTAQAKRFARWDAGTLDDVVDALGLQAHRAKPLYMLSTGTRRKALVAAALASGAALTLLDMPFAALDNATCRSLRDILTDCAEHPQRAFVVADYAAPAGLAAQRLLNLDALTP